MGVRLDQVVVKPMPTMIQPTINRFGTHCSSPELRMVLQPSPTLPLQSASTSPKSVTFDSYPQPDWKTFTHTNPAVSFSYPPSLIMQPIRPSGNPHNTAYSFSGTEGKIWVEWGTGFGGGCPPLAEDILLTDGSKVWTCQRIRSDGTETWDMYPNSSSFLRLQANQPLYPNEAMILAILSNLRFK